MQLFIHGNDPVGREKLTIRDGVSSEWRGHPEAVTQWLSSDSICILSEVRVRRL